MRKMVRYLFVSVIAVMLFIGLGYITYSAMGKPFPALGFSGGEYEEYYGIGFTVEKWYPLMKVGEEYTGRTKQFSFNYKTFAIGIVFFLAIQWIIMFLTNKLRRIKS